MHVPEDVVELIYAGLKRGLTVVFCFFALVTASRLSESRSLRASPLSVIPLYGVLVCESSLCSSRYSSPCRHWDSNVFFKLLHKVADSDMLSFERPRYPGLPAQLFQTGGRPVAKVGKEFVGNDFALPLFTLSNTSSTLGKWWVVLKWENTFVPSMPCQ